MKSISQMLQQVRGAAVVGACAGLMMLSSAASAALVSTGYDAYGNLAAVNGTVDANWTVFYNPNPTGLATGPNTAYAVVSGWPVAPIGPWLGPDGLSTWIAPSFGVTSPLAGNVAGYYNFVDSFMLGDASTFTLKGRFAVDNGIVKVLVNGNETGITLAATGTSDFDTWHDFNITASYLFNSNAMNYLTFQVQNLGNSSDPAQSGNPVGLRVEVPEPGTLALVGLALFGFGAVRRRKQK
jgi:hypothetical protein